jgi:predicted ATP-grasp superfamily ATP-dependent carboligase
LSLPRDFGVPYSPAAVVRAARQIPHDAVVYLSGFENDPDAVRSLGEGRALWGNTPEVLRRVRDPVELADALARCGVSVPPVYAHGSHNCAPEASDGEPWLLKPRSSGGGHGVRPWVPGTPVPPGHYLQRFIGGIPASVVFVAAGGRSVPIGISKQLVGQREFGASGFRYCGNILSPGQFGLGDELFPRVRVIVDAVSQTFGMAGVGSVDFIALDGVPYPIEVNPRWSASMELVEAACGVPVFALHAAACARGDLPSPDFDCARSAYGKAVVFARQDVVVAADTQTWLRDPCLRDVPRSGERIAAGHPVCTVLAQGPDDVACHAALVRRADQVYASLSPV